MNAAVNPAVTHVNQCAAAAKSAWRQLRIASSEAKNRALIYATEAIKENAQSIIQANIADVARARASGREEAYIDRLLLTPERIDDMIEAIKTVVELPDPLATVLGETQRPNGLIIRRMPVPIGVIGMIFESRPNVAADASALCIKSGNAVVLRGGSDGLGSVAAIVACMQTGLTRAGLPRSAVEVVTMSDRIGVKALLQCTDSIDLIIPRGGKSLVERVVADAKVPTLQHLDGNCHTYIHESADAAKAVAVVHNAKLRRTGICGATESLVVDKKIAPDVLPRLLDAMPRCEFRGDPDAQAADSRITAAAPEDFATEFLDSVVSVKVVSGIDAAIEHIDRFSSGHTDAIITEDQSIACRFLNEIDSAVVMHNASTQFSDGGEFGMGAEIGIATGRLHARGPVGLEQLVTYKYCVLGEGQTRS